MTQIPSAFPKLIGSEVDKIELVDRRLEERAKKIVRSVSSRPAAGFPAVFDEAELEAFYRFARNKRLEHQEILRPHVAETVCRMREHADVVVAHDTTIFNFGGETLREGLAPTQKRGSQGFLGHFALALSTDEAQDPLGILGLVPLVRQIGKSQTALRKRGKTFASTTGKPTEQDRWLSLIDRVEEEVKRPGVLIHVMDREADDYHLLSRLLQAKRRFVVRLCYDRVLDSEETGSKPGQRTKEYVATRPVVCKRSAKLSRRGHKGSGRKKKDYPGRQERVAQLGVSGSQVVMRRPRYHGKDLLPQLTLNVVHVREVQPPKAEAPVEWFLLTTEPIETAEQLWQVVDRYRSRWRIEEYFKALKTGCAYEKRQLESLHSLLNTLALLVPIAWGLLRLRALCHKKPKGSATGILTATQILVLRRVSKSRLPPNLSIQRALRAIAELGGHLKHNGPPGWQVLGRGYQKLLALEEGFLLGQP